MELLFYALITMNNLKYFRELSSVTPKQLSKLLNVTVHTYIGFEQNKISIPMTIVKMIGRMYSISCEEIFVPHDELAKTTKDMLCSFRVLNEGQRFELLCGNLTNGEKTNLTYRDVRKIKNAILEIQSDTIEEK